MASECSVTDQSVNELTGVKILGDDTKEEEKHEAEDGSVSDKINKEEVHEHVSSSSGPAVETNEGKSNDVEIFTSKEPVNSAFKLEDLKAAEVAQTSENETKAESLNDKVKIEIAESEDSKDDVRELVHTEVPVSVFPNASEVPEEINVVDRSTLTSISVPVNNLEAESGSPEEHKPEEHKPEEHKPEENADTKAAVELIKSEDTKGELHELFPAEISVVDSEVREENSVDSITPTTIEVTSKDTESSVSLEERIPEECGETKEDDEFSRSEDSKEEVHELVPTEVSINAQVPENTDVGSSTAIVVVPLKDFEVEADSSEELKTELGAESEVKELIKSGDSKEEGQELVSEEVPTDISEAPKKNDVDLTIPTSTEVPLKDLEVESRSPKELKLEENAVTNVDIELIKSGELTGEGQDFVSGEVPIDTSEAPEKGDVDLSAPTSTVVPVKNVEVESCSPEEQKSKEGAETKTDVHIAVFPNASEVPEEIDVVDRSTLTSISVPVENLEAESGSPGEHKPEESAENKADVELIKSEDTKGEVHELFPAEISAVTSEAPEENTVDLNTPNTIEVPSKDPGSYSVSLEEKKPENCGETTKHDELSRSEGSKEVVHEFVPTEVSIKAQAPENSDAGLSTPAIVEVPVKDFEVESGSPEELKTEVGAEFDAMELIKSGDSTEEGQELVSEVPTGISEAPKRNDVDLSTPTSTEVPLKELEVESGTPEEQKLEECAVTKVEIELIKSGELKDEGQDLVPGEVPTDTSEAPEKNDVDLSTPTSTEIPINDLEIESSSPNKQNPEEGPETKFKIELGSGDSQNEGREAVSAEVRTNASKELEKSDVNSSTPTSIEVPDKDLEVESGSPTEKKLEETAETKVNIEFIKSGDEGLDLVSREVATNTSEAPEINDVELNIPSITDVHVKDLGVESSSTVEQKLEERAETKVAINLFESGDSKDEGQESVSSKVSTNVSEEPENNNVDSSSSTIIEVPVKDLEVESGSPDEQKIEESAETKVNTDFIKSGESKDEGQDSGEVFTSSSKVPEINDVDLGIPTSTEVHVKDLEADSGSIEEQKLEEGTITKAVINLIKSGESKDEGQESVSSKISTNASEEFENNNVGSNSSTSIEVAAKDLEVESGSPEEQKIEESTETKVNADLSELGESKDEGQDSREVPTSSSEAPEIDDVDLSIPISTEVPVKDLEVESGSPKEQKSEEGGAETIVNTTLIESGDSRVEGQESVSAEVPTSNSEEPENNNTDLSTETSIEEPVKDLEVESGSPEENKLEGRAEIEVNTDFIKSGESKDEGQELVSGQVPANTSREPEINYVNLSAPTSTEIPVKDLEVEYGSPEEQKIEESAETNVNADFIKLGESKDERQDSGEVPTSSSEAPEIDDVDLSIPTSTEVPVKDVEVESGSPEEQKPEEGAETIVNAKLIESGDSKVEGQESVSAKIPTSTSEEPENNNSDLSTITSIEGPVKNLEVESGSPEENKLEGSAEIEVNTDFIKSGESKDEGLELVSGQVPSDTSIEPEINCVNLSAPTSTEIPVKDLEVESVKDLEVESVKDLEVEFGSPEEQNIEESTETKVNADFIKLGESNDERQDFGEVPTSSSEAPEIDDADLSIPTSTEVPVKDVEVESGSPEEQKPEEGAETIVNTKLIESGDSKVEGLESVSAEIPTSTSKEPDNNNADLSTKTSIEVPVKDLEVESGSPDENKLERSTEIEVNTDFIKSGESKDEGQDLVSDQVPTSTFKEPEINNVNLSAPTSTEVPVKDLEVESGSPEELKPEDGGETKVNIEFIEVGDVQVEGQELVSGEVHSSTTEAPRINDVDLSTTNTEVPVNDLEIESVSLDERKTEQGPETKVDIELIESGNSTVEGQGLVSAKVPSKISEESENNIVDSSTPTSTEITVKDLEVDSGSPEEQKPEVKIKVESDDSKVEDQKLVSEEVSDNTSNAPGKEDVELSTPTSTEVLVKDLEAHSGPPEEQKPEESVKSNVDIKSIPLGDSKDEGQGTIYAEVPTNTSEECENNNVDLTSTPREVPVKILVVESGSSDEQNPKENVETKEPSSDVTTIDGGGEVTGSSSYEEQSSGAGEVVDKEDEGLKEEVIQTRIEEDQTPDEGNLSETVVVKKDDEIVEDVIDGSTVLDVVPPVDQVLPGEVVEERKDETSELGNTGTALKVSEVSLAGGNVLEKDVNVEAIERDLAETSIDSTVGGVSTEEAKNPENVDVEPLKLKFKELDVSPEVSEVLSVGEGVLVGDETNESSKGEERKDKISEVDNTDGTPNVPEVSTAAGNVLKKDVLVEAVERYLVEISIDSTIGEVSSEQAKSPGIVGEELSELKSEEHHVSPEASEVPSVGDRVSIGDEKSESSKRETEATLVETPKDMTSSDESLAHLVEETKNECSKSKTEASVEHFPEAVKEIIASESHSEKKNETSRDLSIEEKNANANRDKKDEIKVEGVIENAPEHEELGIEKKESEKPKDEEPIVYSDTRDVKLIKEATKRESNIFSKMKRTIVKAKKAILGKSPGPKTLSSESKDVKI